MEMENVRDWTKYQGSNKMSGVGYQARAWLLKLQNISQWPGVPNLPIPFYIWYNSEKHPILKVLPKSTLRFLDVLVRGNYRLELDKSRLKQSSSMWTLGQLSKTSVSPF